MLQYFKVFVLATLLLVFSHSEQAHTSPLYGGNQLSVAKELSPKEREVRLQHGVAECVRTAWIGDVRNRTVICVEYRHRKETR
jgi:hypothetical protein